jgi:hypothetical protein
MGLAGASVTIARPGAVGSSSGIETMTNRHFTTARPLRDSAGVDRTATRQMQVDRRAA